MAKSPSNIVFLVSVVALIALAFHRGGAEGYRTDALGATSQPRRPSIFVSVASYRDSECSKTIHELFSKAAYPERVFVGVCEQNSSDPNETCSGDHDPRFDKQIRTIRVPHTEAKGPCVARYACSTLFGSEDYYMQIDSHTIMTKNWDEKAVNEILACPVPDRSVLSMYPNDIGTYTIETTVVPVMSVLACHYHHWSSSSRGRAGCSRLHERSRAGRSRRSTRRSHVARYDDEHNSELEQLLGERDADHGRWSA